MRVAKPTAILERVLSFISLNTCDGIDNGLTTKVWRLRVGETTADDYIRCGPNQPQKNAALAIRNHCLVGWHVGFKTIFLGSKGNRSEFINAS